MASNLPSIVAAIKALALSYNGKNTGTRSGETINNTAEIADLPVRIFSALGTMGGQAVRRTFGAGSVLSMRWEITDILLGQRLELSRGIKDQSAALIQYAADYAEAIRSLSAGNYTLDDLAIRPGTVEWPQGSGTYFYGVECTVTVKEIVQ
jgi:hypothetical protein